MAHVLIVRFMIRAGEEARAEDLVRQLVEASSKEPGNVHYIGHRDPDDRRVLVMYEQYRDQEALEEHRQSEHFQRLAVDQLLGLVDSVERFVYETIE